MPKYRTLDSTSLQFQYAHAYTHNMHTHERVCTWYLHSCMCTHTNGCVHDIYTHACAHTQMGV
jgi:hypothetical protein